MRAEELVNVGYQRLLTFEVDGGGFEWYGRPPANIVLSAYGLLEFKDMSKVFEVDERILERTRAYILGCQDQATGSWDLGGASTTWSWTDLSGRLVVTAYVTWSLAEAGERGPEVAAAVAYLKAHVADAGGSQYALALVANALVAFDPADPGSVALLDRLDAAQRRDAARGVTWWEANAGGADAKGSGPTVTFATGDSATIETTALVAYAMIRTSRFPGTVNGALTYLAKSKDARGTWGSTSATILAMKAILAGMGEGTLKGPVEISFTANGVTKKVSIAPDQGDVLSIVDLHECARKGTNEVTVEVQGESKLMYQLVARHWLPWAAVEGGAAEKGGAERPLDIKVAYDRTSLAKNDVLRAEATVRYKGAQPTFMVVVELGIPPGFTVDTDGLDALVADGRIDRYGLTGRQILLYLGAVQPGQWISLPYSLRARFPVKAKAPKSVVYEYYTPAHRAESAPVEVEVRGE